MKVAVFGLGYVGTVTAAVLASSGHDVWGVDIDPTKCGLVGAGRSPVIEPGIDELLSNCVLAGRLTATMDPRAALDGAEVSLVCVGTPSSARGSADLAHVDHVVRGIAEVLGSGVMCPRGRHAVVLRSTAPPGTMDTVVEPLLNELAATRVVVVGTGVCPEFLREGSAISDFLDAPFTVVGTQDPHVADTMRRLFTFLPQPVQIVSTRSAEGLKYACNAFHATKISFANEVGRLFRLLGVDARQVMELFRQDGKLNLSGEYLAPGFAFGGSCLPKDLRSLLYLARMSCIDLPLLSGVLASNELAISEVVNRVVGSDCHSVAILGLSFKMHSDDLRESPYVDLAEMLLGKGFDVRIFDPLVDTSRLVGANRRHLVSKLPHVQRALCPTAGNALDGAEVAVVSSSDSSVVKALVEAPPLRIFDLSGRLGPEVEALSGYEGVAW